VSLSLVRPTPHDGRVGSADDVLMPRPRLSLRRQIMAVLVPAFAEPGRDMTAYARAPHDVAAEAAESLTRLLHGDEVVTATDDGRLILRLRHEDRGARPVRLQEMAYHAIEAFDRLGYHAGVLDLGVGWAPITRKRDPEVALEYADAAARESVRQRDLQPLGGDAPTGTRSPKIGLWSFSHQVLLATVGSILLPFLGLVAAYLFGVDLSSPLYWGLVGALGVTAVLIWSECFRALEPPVVPPAPDGPAPRATAVIAAYLPNEADTIVETLEAFLRQEYSGGLQVVLAYNTPGPMEVEPRLQLMAQQHPELDVIRVEDSTSKAQNVNAALRVAEGEFVGIFDADHHPMEGAFERAWCWLADGADVVQGHCVIRNGADSWLTRLIAVEFEQIYAVAHPGRAGLHDFGIFGGSNGYWRASALERVRLRGSFLTEDIEASMRVLQAGGTIVNDPGLVSHELAPDNLKTLWRQRMRWAQGWFQVSCRHLGPALTSPYLSLRQKLGVAYLLGFREVYAWIAMLAWPLIGFLAWRDGGIDFSSPIFTLATLFILVSGPVQTLAAWRLATPELRRHPRWFLFAAVANLFFYTELKNLIARIAHLKQLRGEHQWVVTPRTAPSTSSTKTTPTTDPEVAA
jgi:cellulose synthase/poly-beta-1,6-N-acetylglucosamine synthase-like glycosyltransferase